MGKRYITFILSLVICLQLFCSCVMTDSDKTSEFEEYRADFELMTTYLLSVATEKGEGYYHLTRDEDKIIGITYNKEDISLSSEQLQAINNISDLFYMDFSYVLITNQRVDYGGDGYIKYVYSIDGSTPDYFFDESENYWVNKYNLGNGWFLLKAAIR